MHIRNNHVEKKYTINAKMRTSQVQIFESLTVIQKSLQHFE